MSASPLTPEFRAEAMVRLQDNVVFAELDSRGIGVVGKCLVPAHVVMPRTNKIDPAKNTYQKVMVNGVSYQAHDLTLTVVYNRHLEKNEEGMHLCNNPACRNPAHLKLGTGKENMKYAKQCGRVAKGIENGHSTHPEKTPRGDSHYRSILRGEKRQQALRLLKKYDGQRGAAEAMAKYFGVSRDTIYNLKRCKAHLALDIEPSDINLDIKCWVHGEGQRKASTRLGGARAILEKNVRSMRQQFQETPNHARRAMALRLADEYSYDVSYVLKILKQDIFPEMTPDIPKPTYFGIGSRLNGKNEDREGLK